MLTSFEENIYCHYAFQGPHGSLNLELSLKFTDKIHNYRTTCGHNKDP